MESVVLLDVIGLFIFLAGFVIGLGAVTVIDIHGFLGRRSHYWTEATVRTHKVTKPLIWIGIVFGAIGGAIYYRHTGLTLIPMIHLVELVVLVLNGCFLTFGVSRYLLRKEREGNARELLPVRWQAGIIGSFIISFMGWWSALFFLCWHVIAIS